MDKNTLPFKVSIASPCHARWEDMGGGDQVRFCDHCRKNVYNVSTMTSAEATSLLQMNSGQPCVRIYQRADGTVLTEDCPVGVARYWRRVKSLVVGGMAAIILVLVNSAAFGRDNDDGDSGDSSRSRVLLALDDLTNIIKSWAGVKPVVMGKVGPTMGSPLLTPANNSLPSPKMGEAALVPTTNMPIPLPPAPSTKK